ICGWVIFWTTMPGQPSPFPRLPWGLSWLPTFSCDCVPRNWHDCHKGFLPTMDQTLVIASNFYPLVNDRAETLLYPIERKRRKEENMTTGDLIALHFDSLRRLPFTRQYLVILRDQASSRGLPVSLTEAEFNALEVAFRARQYAAAGDWSSSSGKS